MANRRKIQTPVSPAMDRRTGHTQPVHQVVRDGQKPTLAERMHAFDGSFAPNWEPQPGDVLVGRVVRYSVGPETEYGRSPVVTIRCAGGQEYSVWLSSQVLLEKFKTLRPKPGDEVGIKYMGLRTPKSGRGKGYHDYHVEMDGEVADPLAVLDQGYQVSDSDEDIPL